MTFYRAILGILAFIVLFKGVVRVTGSTDSMLNRGAGFGFGNGSGMNHHELRNAESGFKMLGLVAVLFLLLAASYY